MKCATSIRHNVTRAYATNFYVWASVGRTLLSAALVLPLSVCVLNRRFRGCPILSAHFAKRVGNHEPKHRETLRLQSKIAQGLEHKSPPLQQAQGWGLLSGGGKNPSTERWAGQSSEWGQIMREGRR